MLNYDEWLGDETYLLFESITWSYIMYTWRQVKKENVFLVVHRRCIKIIAMRRLGWVKRDVTDVQSCLHIEGEI